MKPVTKDRARIIVSQIREQNPQLSKKEIVKALVPFGIPKSTAYRVLKKIEADGHAQHPGKGNAGRKRVKMIERKRNMLVRAASNKVGVSVRNLAKKYDISKSYVQKILKEKGVKYLKRKKSTRGLSRSKNPAKKKYPCTCSRTAAKKTAV